MKACSFVPAATVIITELGLGDVLQGVTFECESDKPKIVRSHLEGKSYSSAEIDQVVNEWESQGKSLYYVDIDLLKKIAPDVVFTQSVCDVCEIGTAYVEQALAKLESYPKVVPCKPKNLDDVFKNTLEIAKALGHENRGHQLLETFEGRIDTILDTLRKSKAPLRRVMVMEWLDPIYNCGHWIPYQIAKAGGVDMLSNPGSYSIPVPWEKVQKYDPEVLVVAPCGFSPERALEEIGTLTNQPGWDDLTSVRNGATYVADANYFTEPSTRLVDGIELLAALFYPQIFTIPQHMQVHIVKL